MLNALRRDVYYTRTSLLQDINSSLSLKLKPVRRIARMPMSKLSDYFEKRTLIEIDEAEIRLAKDRLIFIFNSGSRSSASDIARVLAVKSAKSGRKVALCDTSGRSNTVIDGNNDSFAEKMSTEKSETGVHILQGYSERNGIAFFTSSNFKSNIQNLLDQFDQIYVCSDHKKAYASLAALEPFMPTIVLLTKIRKTKKSNLRRLLAAHPIGIAFNE